ncbi:MAG: flagellar basal body-associated FliL family protein [Pseudomonadota bacterium]|uniref:Flagellar protein FliL n=1 Tax=Caldimonas aquatica TaxID=376175 RepID=A0ABY6MUQ3_9BURK|nr:flagellar basal body-associated FliL family protein [Schlegelella aquatica]UZD55729.1 flagellar basal body-associated FliL family protein [Schlegelella aquatica]
MSAAAATAEAPKTGKKKLILIAAVVALLLAAAAVAGVLWMRKNAQIDEEIDTEEEVVEAPAKSKKDKSAPPVFLSLEPFTVNLADKNAERYAQIGVTLEVDSPEMADKLKSYMPAIRNNVLMVLAHKTSDELLERAGKEKLAREIMRASVRPLGIELEDEQDQEAASDDENPQPKKRKKKKEEYNPVRQVLFSSFIIQ